MAQRRNQKTLSMTETSRTRALFLQATENFPPAQWGEFLNNACAADTTIRQDVEKLLNAHLDALRASDVTETFSGSRPNHDHDSFVPGLSDPEASKVGHFRLLKLVGRGGMGNVFCAKDEQLDRTVALKLPRIDVIGNPDLVNRFLKEARLAASLSHPGLVAIHDFGIYGQVCYIVSKWCPFGDLSAWLKKNPGPHDVRRIARFIQELATAVAHCHASGVLHLDIKPGNIMLNRNDNEAGPGSPMLTDFGLARMLEENLIQTHSSLMSGTPLYMAPEQADCRMADIGTHTDIFSIGVVLYELLYDTRPFEGRNAMEILDRIRSDQRIAIPRRPNIPRELQVICEVCLERRPQDRYSSATGLAEDLGRFLHGDPIQIKPVARRRRLLLTLQKPERIWQAGLMTVSIQMPMIALMLILWILMTFGLISTMPHGWSKAAFPFLLVLLTIHIPSLLVGMQSMKYRWWSIPAGLFLSLNFLIPTMLVVAGIMKPMSVYEGEPLAAFLMHYSFGIFAAFQTFFCLIAVPAALQERNVQNEMHLDEPSVARSFDQGQASDRSIEHIETSSARANSWPSQHRKNLTGAATQINRPASRSGPLQLNCLEELSIINVCLPDPCTPGSLHCAPYPFIAPNCCRRAAFSHQQPSLRFRESSRSAVPTAKCAGLRRNDRLATYYSARFCRDNKASADSSGNVRL